MKTDDESVVASAASLKKIRARIDELESQLPEGMEHCTIRLKSCGLGHTWLTATNWVQHGCPTCRIADLERHLAARGEQAP